MSCYRGLRCKEQHLLFNSLNKYGWENHHLEILAEGEMTQDEINRLEIEAIAEAKAAGLSLNIQNGGLWTPPTTDNPVCKPVMQFDLDGKLIKEWPSMADAERFVPGVAKASLISITLIENRCYSQGYLWLLKSDYDQGKRPHRDLMRNRSLRAVVQLSLNGAFVAEHRSVSAAARSVEGVPQSINRCLMRDYTQSMGFLWCYKDDYDQGYRPKSSVVPDNRKAVQLIRKDGTVLQEFASMREAEASGIYTRNAIRDQCEGKTKPRRDRHFRYKPI